MATMSRGFACLMAIAAAALVWQAATNAPTSDEVGHLVAGVATVRYGDPGYYRVNPPLHKLISGVAVELLFAPELVESYPASQMRSGYRQEFLMAMSVLSAAGTTSDWWFVVGRLVRIPLILFVGWVLFRSLTGVPVVARFTAAALWLTSPLMLGHGWVIMPDAIAACAMVFLLVATIHWLDDRDYRSSASVGLAWGLAIGTKFTFCPLFAVWPAVLLVHQAIVRRLDRWEPLRLLAAHAAHGLIALGVVILLYGGQGLGVPLGEHRFQSVRLAEWTRVVEGQPAMKQALAPWIAACPSPFPHQFMIGIDEQQLDLERGYPTYVMGRWYPEGIWWYYLFGILAKEQIVFWAGLLVLPAGLALLCFHHSTGDVSTQAAPDNGHSRRLLATFATSLLTAGIIVMVLSLHSKMALNVRYALPGLPPLYLAIGIAVQRCQLAWPRWTTRLMVVGGVLVLLEMVCTLPFYYSYINPLLGGKYASPLVLHDSNFDGGQDLWRFEHAVRRQRWPEATVYAYLNSGVPETCLREVVRPPSVSTIERLIASRERRAGRERPPGWRPQTVLVISRGFQAPAPWTGPVGNQPAVSQEQLQRLLALPADEMLTPTLTVYYE